MLIIEDDVEFDDLFFEKLNAAWLTDFDMLFLNGTHGVHRKPVAFNEHWLSVSELYGAFGYIVNARFYDTILMWLKRENYPADAVFSMFMQLHKCYKLIKPIVFHRPGMSDIQGIVPRNYKHLEKKKLTH